MIKYVPEDTSVCFAEIPDEINLCINLSCCPHRCQGCHSPYLQTDMGEELTISVVDNLINKHQGITCVVFMGGDSDKCSLIELAKHIRSNYDLSIGWYSGESELDLNLYGNYFDYIKVGSYIKDLGPLNSPTTNQRLYFIKKYNKDIFIEDITSSFWK